MELLIISDSKAVEDAVIVLGEIESFTVMEVVASDTGEEDDRSVTSVDALVLKLVEVASEINGVVCKIPADVSDSAVGVCI